MKTISGTLHACAAASLFAVALTQTACTAVTGQAYAGYERAAKKGIETADDNHVQTILDDVCAVPYGAVIRNTRFIPVAKAACLPAGPGSAPATLLDGVPDVQVPSK